MVSNNALDYPVSEFEKIIIEKLRAACVSARCIRLCTILECQKILSPDKNVHLWLLLQYSREEKTRDKDIIYCNKLFQKERFSNYEHVIASQAIKLIGIYVVAINQQKQKQK